MFLERGRKNRFPPTPALFSLPPAPPPPSPAASAEAHLYDPKPTCENARRSRGALSHTRHTQARPPGAWVPRRTAHAARRLGGTRAEGGGGGGGGGECEESETASQREREKEEGRGAAGRGKTRRREGARVGPGSGAAGREKKRNAETPPARPGAPGPPRSAGGPGRTAGRGTPSARRRAATRDPRPGIEKSLRGPLSRLSRTRGAGGGGRRGAGAPPAGAHLGGQAPARPGVPEAEADPRRRGRRREAGEKGGREGEVGRGEEKGAPVRGAAFLLRSPSRSAAGPCVRCCRAPGFIKTGMTQQKCPQQHAGGARALRRLNGSPGTAPATAEHSAGAPPPTWECLMEGRGAGRRMPAGA